MSDLSNIYIRPIHEINEVNDEENWGVTLDLMLSIKTATLLDTNG